jgi:hypothetical protein
MNLLRMMKTYHGRTSSQGETIRIFRSNSSRSASMKSIKRANNVMRVQLICPLLILLLTRDQSLTLSIKKKRRRKRRIKRKSRRNHKIHKSNDNYHCLRKERVRALRIINRLLNN